MVKVSFWFITYKDISQIPLMLDKISTISNFTFNVHILDNTDCDASTIHSLKKIQDTYSKNGIDINVYFPGTNLYWSKGMNYLDKNTPFTPYVIYICSKHITINDITGFDDLISPLIENSIVAQTGRLTRCAGLYYFKAQNAPWGDNTPGGLLYRFPHYLPKLEGKFSRLEIFKNNRIFMHIQGGLFAFNRQIFRNIGGCEEALIHYFSDLELSVRLQCYGYKLIDVPTIYSAANNIETIPDKKFKILHSYSTYKES